MFPIEEQVSVKMLPLKPAAVRFSMARYARQIRLPELGIDGQQRLRDSNVLVLGAGGLGSPVLQYLAAAGVGRIGIIDDDVVEESNLHRQVLHDASALGLRKVESAQARINAQVGDAVEVEIYPERLTEQNAERIFSAYDLVIDGADNFPTRYLVADVSTKLNLPVVWGSILGFNSQVAVFWADPPKELGGGPGVTLRDVFPEPPAPGTVPSCAEAGVIGALCGQAGSIMAMEALKILAQFGEPLFGRLLVIDALRATSHEIPLRPEGKEPQIIFPTKPRVEFAQVASNVVLEGGWTLVDVRERQEYDEGHAAGAVLVPLSELTAITAPAWAASIRDLAGGDRIALYCQAGVRSRQAAELLVHAGLEGVYLLAGDYPGWAGSALPTERTARRLAHKAHVC